jgi:hypothetical protein
MRRGWPPATTPRSSSRRRSTLQSGWPPTTPQPSRCRQGRHEGRSRWGLCHPMTTTHPSHLWSINCN